MIFCVFMDNMNFYTNEEWLVVSRQPLVLSSQLAGNRISHKTETKNDSKGRKAPFPSSTISTLNGELKNCGLHELCPPPSLIPSPQFLPFSPFPAFITRV